MPMKISHHTTKTGRFARILIWTIHKQDLIAYHIRLYVYCAVAIILILTLSQKIPLEMALLILLACGLVIGFGLWAAIERRRSWLLGITDPQLKKEIHAVMLAYLANKTRDQKMNFIASNRMGSNQAGQNKMEQKEESYIH